MMDLFVYVVVGCWIIGWVDIRFRVSLSLWELVSVPAGEHGWRDHDQLIVSGDLVDEVRIVLWCFIVFVQNLVLELVAFIAYLELASFWRNLFAICFVMFLIWANLLKDEQFARSLPLHFGHKACCPSLHFVLQTIATVFGGEWVVLIDLVQLSLRV